MKEVYQSGMCFAGRGLRIGYLHGEWSPNNIWKNNHQSHCKAIVKKIRYAIIQIEFIRITSNQVFQIWVVLSFYASLGTIQASPDSPASAVWLSWKVTRNLMDSQCGKKAHLVAAQSWSPPTSTHGSRFFLMGWGVFTLTLACYGIVL